MKVSTLFRKPLFWIGVILLFIFALIFDMTMGAFVLVKSLSSGQWSNMLLGLGGLYAGFAIYQSYLPKTEQKQWKWASRVLIIAIAILTFQDYGYFKMLYFLATVFLFSRFLKWTIHKVFTRRPAFHT